MHELSVSQEVKELVSGIVAHAAAKKGKKNVWNEVQIGQDCQECNCISLFSFEAESKGDQKANSQVGECVYHLFYPFIKGENCENIYL